MRFRPGSVPWLAAHEARLAWRELLGLFSRGQPHRERRVLRLFGAALALLQVLAVLGVAVFAAMPSISEFLRRADQAAVVGPYVLLASALMVGQALNAAAQALYGRGDLVFLLSSPVPAARILAVRAAVIAASTAASVSPFVLPLVNALALFGYWRLLAVYPLLLILGCMATAVALVVTRVLFAAFGPRSTRRLAQILAAATPAAIPLMSQSWQTSWTEQASPRGVKIAAGWEMFGPESPLWWPVQVLLDGPLHLLIGLIAAAALLAATTRALGGWFCAAAVAAAGLGRGRPRRSGLRAPAFTPSPSAVLRRKEAALLMRDPWLLSQVLLPILFLVPLGLALWRTLDKAALLPLTPLLVLMTGHLAGALAWLAMSGEEAPELVASAPVTARSIARAKIEVVGGALALILIAPIALVARSSLLLAGAAVLGCAAAAASAILIQLWFAKPGLKRDMQVRLRRSTITFYAEFAVSTAWAIATLTLVLAKGFVVVPAAAAFALLVAVRTAAPSHRPRRPRPVAAPAIHAPAVGTGRAD